MSSSKRTMASCRGMVDKGDVWYEWVGRENYERVYGTRGGRVEGRR